MTAAGMVDRNSSHESRRSGSSRKERSRSPAKKAGTSLAQSSRK